MNLLGLILTADIYSKLEGFIQIYRHIMRYIFHKLFIYPSGGFNYHGIDETYICYSLEHLAKLNSDG